MNKIKKSPAPPTTAHACKLYRKKPVVIAAFQFDGDLMDSKGRWYVPYWAIEAYHEGNLYFIGAELYIETLEGVMHVPVGNYVIRGVDGELYSCREDIFNKTYEEVE